jgi:hypothetical protein
MAALGTKTNLKNFSRRRPPNVCFGSKADICAAKSDVRFTPR